MKDCDFSGLECPQPVVRLKKIVGNESGEALRITVDNLAAKENVLRFLKSHSITPREVLDLDGKFVIVTEKIKSVEGVEEEVEVTTGVTYIIDKDSIGKGDEELGKKLLVAFQNTLSEVDPLPKTLFFMNKGVFFTLDDSPTLTALKALEAAGVEIITCGTCTNFFEVTERVALGELGTMYDLLDLYNRTKVVTL